MPSFVLLFSLILLVASAPGPKKKNFAPDKLHALLIAGSNGFENYRHQADVAHAYHLLIQKGVPAENIIVMMYDDIANNPQNPYPGQLRNAPNGPDYYKGLKIDYRQADVNVDNFVAVLVGDANSVKGKHNTGRVLKTTTDDNIFLFYADHGAVGLVGMPVGRSLTKATLQDAINRATYNQLSVYIESCESGSMLAGMEDNSKVFGLTASTADQPSWACNCQGSICYGDLFSVSWMSDSEKHNLNSLDLGTQYTDVKGAVHRSTVCRFGNSALNGNPVSHFQGQNGDILLKEDYNLKGEETMVLSRNVPLYYYRSLAEQASFEEERTEALRKLDYILRKRVLVDAFVDEMVSHLADKVLFTNAKKENDCLEKLVEEFDISCFPLGSNPYLASQMPIFSKIIEGRDCSALIKELRTLCAESNFTEDKTEQFI